MKRIRVAVEIEMIVPDGWRVGEIEWEGMHISTGRETLLPVIGWMKLVSRKPAGVSWQGVDNDLGNELLNYVEAESHSIEVMEEDVPPPAEEEC